MEQSNQPVQRENAADRNESTPTDYSPTQQNNSSIYVEESEGVEIDHHTQMTQKEYREPPKYQVQDPFRLNERAAFAQWAISLLPVNQQSVDLLAVPSLVSGVVGVVLSLTTLTGQSPYPLVSFTIANPQSVFVLSIAVTVIAGGYIDVRRQAECPECNTPFGLRTEETNRYDLSNPDEKRGEKVLECTECGEEVRRPLKFTQK